MSGLSSNGLYVKLSKFSEISMTFLDVSKTLYMMSSIEAIVVLF